MKRKAFISLIFLFTLFAGYGQGEGRSFYGFYKSGHGYGFIDSSGVIAIKPKFEEVSHFREGLAAVKCKEQGLWGFIDVNGEIVIPCIYYKVGDFRNGSSIVSQKRPGQLRDVDNSFLTFSGVIDKYGESIIPIQYQYISSYSSNNLFSACKNNLWGVINIQGDIVLPFENNMTTILGENLFSASKMGKEFLFKNGVMLAGKFDYISRHIDGLVCAKSGGKHGVIDDLGVEVLPFLYEQPLSILNSNLIAIKYDSIYQFVDRYGINKFSIKGQRIQTSKNNIIFYDEGRAGLLDLGGRELLKAVYDDIEEVSSSIFIVKDAESKKKGLLNLSEPFELDFNFDELVHLEGPLIYFWNFRSIKNGQEKNQTGYINFKGDVVYLREF